MTQIEMAKMGTISPQMIEVSRQENLEVRVYTSGILNGTIVIPANLTTVN
jgi:thiamine biosynthesis protein ThiC